VPDVIASTVVHGRMPPGSAGTATGALFSEVGADAPSQRERVPREDLSICRNAHPQNYDQQRPGSRGATG